MKNKTKTNLTNAKSIAREQAKQAKIQEKIDKELKKRSKGSGTKAQAIKDKNSNKKMNRPNKIFNMNPRKTLVS